MDQGAIETEPDLKKSRAVTCPDQANAADGIRVIRFALIRTCKAANYSAISSDIAASSELENGPSYEAILNALGQWVTNGSGGETNAARIHGGHEIHDGPESGDALGNHNADNHCANHSGHDVGLTDHDCGKTSDGKGSHCQHLELLEHEFPPVVCSSLLTKQ